MRDDATSQGGLMQHRGGGGVGEVPSRASLPVRGARLSGVQSCVRHEPSVKKRFGDDEKRFGRKKMVGDFWRKATERSTENKNFL